MPSSDEPYHQDGLWSIHNHEFMNDRAFLSAYGRGVRAAEQDFNWHWRVHVGLWAARCAIRLAGDFVECGVAKGFLSSAVMFDLRWDDRGRIFWLMDTFTGIDPRYVTEDELREGAVEKSEASKAAGVYPASLAAVERNFADWRNCRIIAGPIPETLPQMTAERIAFLHIDMNCAPPEIAAIGAFWDRLVPGALVLLDDYAYHGYRHQKLAMDAFARDKGVAVLSLPTGQGLILRPPG